MYSRSLAFGAMLYATLSVAVWAADITGTWTGSISSNNGDFSLTYDFKQNGDKFTGTVTGPQGDPLPLTDCKLEGDARIVTFANGTVAREVLVDCDDERRRLVYAIKSERLTQHSASAQVIADGETRCRFVWITDVLPQEIAPYISAQMDAGVAAMQKALSRAKAAV